MNPVFVSYNGQTLDNTYIFKFPAKTPLQAPVDVIWVDRTGAYPTLAGKKQKGKVLSYQIQLLTTTEAGLAAQRQNVAGIFDTKDNTPRQIIIQDADDGNKQYFNYATATTMPDAYNVVTVTLAFVHREWQSVTLNSVSWSVTGSPQTKNFTVAGNVDALLELDIAPTSTGGAYQNRQYLEIHNPLLTKPYPNYPLLYTVNTAALIQDTTISNQINNGAGYTSGATAFAIDTAVGGGLPAAGFGYIQRTGEQFSWTGKTATSMPTVVRGIGGTTAAAILDNDVIVLSHMLANGADVNFYDNGIPINFWFTNINTTATQFWFVLDLSAGVEIGISAALGSSGDTYITFANNAVNLALWNRLQSAGRGIIQSEEISWTAKIKNATTLQLTIGTRGVRDTTAATHAVAQVFKWEEHNVIFLYGNSSATAPTIDDTHKPIFDLATSTNTSWVYLTNFLDATGLRAGSWKLGVYLTQPGNLSGVYTGNHETYGTDPATDLGLDMLVHTVGAAVKSETVTLRAVLYHPAGIVTVNTAAQKYKALANTTWPVVFGLQSSKDGTIWVKEWYELTPGSAATWTNLTNNGARTVTASNPYVSFVISGLTNAVLGNAVSLDVAAASGNSIVPVSANVPQINARSVTGNYHFDATISMDTTLDAVSFSHDLTAGVDTLYMYTDSRTVLLNSYPARGSLTPNTVRQHWLRAPSGARTLTYTATNTGNVTITIKWRDRINIL